jgi:Protein of unknown function (DUF2934)
VNLDTRFQIAERAYFIWKQKGCPDGKALDNWLQAEAEAEAELSTGTTPELPCASAKAFQAKRSKNKKR